MRSRAHTSQRRIAMTTAALLSCALLAACERAQTPVEGAGGDTSRAVEGSPTWFEELSSERSGLDAVLRSGATPSTQILEVKGAGLALIDWDRDGDSDVFLPNGAWLDRPEDGPGCKLWENRGDLRFVDRTEDLRLRLRRWSYGVTVGDYDGDGWDDLFVSCYGPNVLLRNDRGMRFVDVTESAGVSDSRWATGSAFADIDADGDLDLYVCNYLRYDPTQPPAPTMFKTTSVLGGPMGLPAESDILYENLGNGTFRDITQVSGCAAARPAYALNVAAIDLDLDGTQDIYVGNDSMPNYWFRGLGDGRFEEIGAVSGLALDHDGRSQATMGIAIADVDGNGYPDVFTTNFSGDVNTLHLGFESSYFEDRTRQYGLGQESMPFVGWACGFYDFDHDGDEDLLVLNGHVYPQASLETMDASYLQVPLLYEREASRFRRVGSAEGGAWLARPHLDRTACFGDLDGDGDIDVLIGELNGKPRVLRNRVGEGMARRGIIFRLLDERPGVHNRHGLGARVELQQDDHIDRRWIVAGGPFQSSSEPVVQFTLVPECRSREVRVHWPDDTKTVHSVDGEVRQQVLQRLASGVR